MQLIFCSNGLEDIRPPCVAQNFINHDARLFKVFVVKDKYTVIERPSLKNFGPGGTTYTLDVYEYHFRDNHFSSFSEFPTVNFDSHEISKPDSSSSLTQMDDGSTSEHGMPKKTILDLIVNEVRTKLGLTLFGIDIIIEKGSGRYAIIDMNVFPGNCA